MTGDEAVETEEELKRKRFRSFWMGKLVSGFGDDLDVVRQVRGLPHLFLKG